MEISRGGVAGTVNLSSSAPPAIGTAAAGIATDASRSDHVHAGAHANLTGIGTNTHVQIDAHLSASAAHGVSGNVVGSSDIQTLTNKTLASPVISGLIQMNASANYWRFAQTVAGVTGNLRFSQEGIADVFDILSSSAGINVIAGVVKVAGTQVISTRRTGWGTPTGTLLRTALTNGSSQTDFNQELMALITDLIAHGLIGA